MHADVLGERARLSPDREALVFVPTGERFTYGGLDARATRLARLLTGPLGLTRGDRFGLLAHNRVECLDAFFAATKAGLVFVPLGTRLTPRELAPVVEDAGLALLLHAGELRETAAELLALAPGPRAISLDEGLPALLASLPAGELARPPIDPEETCCLLYTSGTTGKPKGVEIPHRMVAANAIATVLGWQLREDDVTPVFTPLYHAGGLFAFLLPIIAIGGRVVLHASFDAADVLAWMAMERATVVLGVPTIWRMLAEHPDAPTTDFSSLRWLISGGAPLPIPVWKLWHDRGLVLKQGYGLTEVGVNCFAMSGEESVAKVGSVGRPLPFTEAKLVDGEGREVRTGETGELLFRGPHVCKGYWKNPEATRTVLDEAGWFHTGDMARRDPDGFFSIVGRRKEMFISGGVNVYPAEVEIALLQHPAVADAAVVGIPDAKWGEVGVAFVVAREGAPLDPASLADFLGERIARFKVPRLFLQKSALPRTPYGKVVKGELLAELLGARA